MEYGWRLMTFFALGAIISVPLTHGDVILTHVARNIDLSSQLIRVQTKFAIENAGVQAIDAVVISADGQSVKHLAFFDAHVKEGDEDDVTKLAFAATTLPGHSDEAFFKVSLLKPLGSKESVTFETTMVFTHMLTPYPAAIGQSEKQQVIYTGSHYLFSPYMVKEQTTTVKLSSSTIESYTKLKPVTASESTITYGPYKDITGFSSNEMKIHYENNSPFLSVTEMTRWIEVSHWGNVAVEETYQMSHEGARLKGHFSRYDYQRTPTYAAIKSFKTVLPASARDVYYRDEIGNISTSNMLVIDDSVEVELRPRFPLFGGWQTRYCLGYNVPTFEYLFNQGDKFVLKMRFVDHIYDDFVVDKMTVKVVLPEGASNIQLKTPYEVKEGARELHKTYLDTLGRPVIVIHKDNLVENHIQDFQVHYTFKKVMLLQEPLLCVAAFYVLFISVIFLVRLDFSISKDAAQDSRMKVAGLLDELRSVCNRRSATIVHYDSAIDTFKSGKDTAVFQSATKKLNGEYSAASQKVTSICASLVKEDPDINDKLVDLQKKEEERKALVDQAANLALKVVAGKLNRQQYADSSSLAQSRRDKLTEEIDAILGGL